MVRRMFKSLDTGRKWNIRWQDFENHHRFSLRCLSKDIILVSVWLKSNIKPPKGRYIVRKVERALLNERVRLINNSLTMFKIQWDTCINNLEKALDRETLSIIVMNLSR